MANLKCTECGRFVNGPNDHDKDCALYGVEQAYVPQAEETTVEPGTETPVEPGVEQPTPEPTGPPNDPQEPPQGDLPVPEPVPGPATDELVEDGPRGLRIIDVQKHGLDRAVAHLQQKGGRRQSRPDRPDVAIVRVPGGLIEVAPDDVLVEDDYGGWYSVVRRVLWPDGS